MWNFIRPILSRIIGAWVAALAVYLSVHYGVVLDESTQQQAVAGFLAVLYGIAQTVYALAHRTADVKVNPTDAASPILTTPKMAEEQKDRAKVLHEGESGNG